MNDHLLQTLSLLAGCITIIYIRLLLREGKEQSVDIIISLSKATRGLAPCNVHRSVRLRLYLRS